MSQTTFYTIILVFCVLAAYGNEPHSLTCRLTRLLHQLINKLENRQQLLLLAPGLEIVDAKAASGVNSTQLDDDSLLSRISTYLRTHEMNIKINELLPNAVLVDLDNLYTNQNAVEPRKKDKSQGLLLAMSVMFAKMMAVLGIGGIGLLALKALSVASAALMMAGMIGLKSLAQQHESPHSVQYVAADGHHHKRRRRRSIFSKFF